MRGAKVFFSTEYFIFDLRNRQHIDIWMGVGMVSQIDPGGPTRQNSVQRFQEPYVCHSRIRLQGLVPLERF